MGRTQYGGDEGSGGEIFWLTMATIDVVLSPFNLAHHLSKKGGEAGYATGSSFGAIVSRDTVVQAKLIQRNALNAELIEAINNRNEDEAISLLARGADPHVFRSWYDESILAAAANRRFRSVVQLLVSKRIDLESRPRVLCDAAREDNPEVVRILLDSGAEINAKWNDRTPLMCAAEDGKGFSTAELLLERGADPNIQSSQGLTALKLAKQYWKSSKNPDHNLSTMSSVEIIRLIEDSEDKYRLKQLNAFSVTVDYAIPLKDAVAAGRYHWNFGVYRNISSKNFPAIRSGTEKTVIILVHLNRNGDIKLEDVIDELDKEGLRPAELRELLAFGAEHPKVQRKFPVVALGSVWQDPDGHRNVPSLDMDFMGARTLNLYWWSSGWGSNTRFAAVRK